MTKKHKKANLLDSKIERVTKGRKKEALDSDNAKRAKTVVTRKDADKWLKHPGQIDLAGVDTPKKKRKSSHKK